MNYMACSLFVDVKPQLSSEENREYFPNKEKQKHMLLTEYTKRNLESSLMFFFAMHPPIYICIVPFISSMATTIVCWLYFYFE